MCRNATATAAALLTAIEPDLVNFLTLLGIANTPDGEAAITAYKAALAAVEAWVPGTTAADVIQVIDAFTQVFNTLPIPADAKTLADLISAGVVAVIGVLTANSPAPALATEPAATPEVAAQAQVLHAHAVAADTEAKVESVTGYKPSVMTKAKVMLGDHGAIAGQWKGQWKKTATAAGPKYESLAA